MPTPETWPSSLEVVALMPVADRVEVTRIAKLVAHAAALRRKQLQDVDAWEDYERRAVLEAITAQSRRLDRRDAVEAGAPLNQPEEDDIPEEERWRPSNIVDMIPVARPGPADLRLPAGDRD